MTLRKVQLSEKKKRWVQNRDVVLCGGKLNYNAAVQQRYETKIKRLVERMTREVLRKIKALFKKVPAPSPLTTDESLGSQARILTNALLEKFTKLFERESNGLAESMIEQTINTSTVDLEQRLEKLSGGLKIKPPTFTPELNNTITASIAENVSLIRTIPQKYLKDVTGAVMRSITSGQGLYDLVPELEKYGTRTIRQAELMAYDQTRKAYTSINVARLSKLGVKKFEWIHSGGGQHPRESHIKIDGKIFSFENLEAEQAALGVPKEDRGLPGYPVNCKCTMGPVIDFDDDE